MAEGTPEQVATVPESHTGRFLAQVLPAVQEEPAEGRRPGGKQAGRASAGTTATTKTATTKTVATKAPAKKAAAAKAARKARALR